MDSLINTIGNLVSSLVEGVAMVSSGLSEATFWAILSGVLLLLAFLMIWLLIRLRHARRVKTAFSDVNMTFEDVSAEAALGQSASTAVPVPQQQGAMEPAMPSPDIKGQDAPAVGENQPTGFRFFKRKAKPGDDPAAAADSTSADDDIYLLGLEQEMLATRQLYLDGLITKEVYITETRALYDKAQSRMT